jgi:hypothetical protein
MKREVEGIPIEVKFGTETDILYINPEGAFVNDSTRMSLDVERVTRAEKRVKQLRKKLHSGTASPDEYEEALAKLDEQMKEGVKVLDEQKMEGKISQKDYNEAMKANEVLYREEVDFLLNKRDGEPLSLEETDRLEFELDEWMKRVSIKPVAVPIMRSCLVDWTLEGDDGEKLPITFDTLSSLPEDFMKLAFMKIFNHYQEEQKAEKKSSENLLNGSASQSQEPVASLNGTATTPLLNGGALAIPTSSSTNGEKESTAAH